MADLKDSRTLTGIANEIPVMPRYLSGAYFSTRKTSDTTFINMDRIIKNVRITPYVAPDHPAKVVSQPGYTPEDFKAAYVKDLRKFLPQDMMNRAAGEPFNTPLAPTARNAQKVGEQIEDQLEMLENRFEVMCGLIMMNGLIVISGDGYPTRTVDFQRDSSITGMFSAVTWGGASATPLVDIDNWAFDIQAVAKGRVVQRVQMSRATWIKMKVATEVKDILKGDSGSRSIGETGPIQTQTGTAKWVMNAGEIPVYVYEAEYEDVDGSTKKIIPDDEILLAGDIGGELWFGAIQNFRAGLQAVRFFTHTFEDNNPSQLMLHTESAPLPLPRYINACGTGSTETS